jgi:hypothetical protein
MRLLLDDRFAPLTHEFGFLELGCEAAAHAFSEWQQSVLHPQLVTARRLAERSLEDALRQLVPLTSIVPTRYLLVAHGSWTAFFTNSVKGSDAASPMGYLAGRLGVRTLRVSAVPHTKQGRTGRFGSTQLEIFGPNANNILNHIRSVAVVNDDGRWEFIVTGTPQPFEELEAYKAKRVRDRFTPETLERYLAALGIDAAFDAASYQTSDAYLVTKSGALPPALREFSLEEARRNL